MHIEEIENDASLLQYPNLPEKRSAWQFLGQKQQFFNSERGSRNAEKSMMRSGDLFTFGGKLFGHKVTKSQSHKVTKSQSRKGKEINYG